MNAGHSLRRGIVDYDFFIGEFAADQRQRVERSIHVELSPAIQAYRMKDEVQSRLPFYIARYYGIAYAASLTVLHQDLVPLKHR